MNSFTIIAKDNIDVNAKSSTGSHHFHGTSMPIMQFPRPEHQTLKSTEYDTSTVYVPKRVDKLPDTYTIKSKPSIPFKNPIYLPVCTINVPVPHSKIF